MEISLLSSSKFLVRLHPFLHAGECRIKRGIVGGKQVHPGESSFKGDLN